jgi:mannose-6-phosphate isomerase-like protein (cupin superfamily)
MEIRSLDAAVPFTTKDGSAIRELLGRPTSSLIRNQSLAEAALEPAQSTERHHHRLSEEIYFVLDGGGLMEVDGVEQEVGPGDAILIPPGAWHSLHAGAGGVRLLCMCAPPYTHDDTYFE